jgi:hypothetical protein
VWATLQGWFNAKAWGSTVVLLLLLLGGLYELSQRLFDERSWFGLVAQFVEGPLALPSCKSIDTYPSQRACKFAGKIEFVINRWR